MDTLVLIKRAMSTNRVRRAVVKRLGEIMPFDPDSITQADLHKFRKAAESAWGEDTRHESYIGHPQPSAGQCYVTSRWLVDKLGGTVGVKDGHYFWVSDDKSHIIDLTGDQFASEPEDLRFRGVKLDEEDEGWEPTEEQTQWHPGPVVYKRADHPLYKGFRVKTFKTENPRVKRFRKRADEALENPHLSKTALDLMGDAYPAEQPQAVEDMNQRYMHDEPGHEPGSGEYNFVYGNGQLHVSPDQIHSHDELLSHAGLSGDSSGPLAAGTISVDRGNALWSVDSNISLRGLQRELREYTKNVGWRWGGLTRLDGEPIDDDFAPRKSMVLLNNETGEKQRIILQGSTAYLKTAPDDEVREGLELQGYKIAEYPGGGDMNDMMHVNSPAGETYEQFDLTNMRQRPEQPERDHPTGTFRCRQCDHLFGSFSTYLHHLHNDHMPKDDPVEDGGFPKVEDTPGFPQHNYHEWTDHTVMPLASYKEASRVEGFDLYSSLWGFDTDDGIIHYGAYSNGELLGYASVRVGGGTSPDEAELIMVQSAALGRGVGRALMHHLQTRWNSLISHSVTPQGAKLARTSGMVNVKGQVWKWAAGQEPKDMLEADLPFIYDIDKDKVVVGVPGGRTSDVPGKFTPGGIVEGTYEPGGKVVVRTMTNMPWTVRHLVDLWYWSPDTAPFRVTGVELQDAEGNSQKLASSVNVGQYIKQLAATDPAAWNAYQALRKAGGRVYVVGGAVRDALLQKEPKDIDLMVAGIPAEVVNHTLDDLPGRVDLTGKRFGVYRYNTKGHEVEVALPRQDKYESGRRGEGQITVDHELPVEKDLERRDFTINSMAVDLDTGELIDPHGGAEDIERRSLRTTHPSSFEEDPTRLVRALVASSRHGLQPTEATRAEMEGNAHRLDHESREPLQRELDKLFSSPNPAGAIRLAQDTGVLKYLLPEVSNNWDFDQNNPHHTHTLGDHSVNVLDHLVHNTSDPDLRLAGLLHDIGKPASEWRDPQTGYSHFYLGPNGEGGNHDDLGAGFAEARLRSLKYPVARINRIKHLIQHHMYPDFSSPKGARKFLHRVGDEHADDLMTLRDADREGKGTPDYQDTKTPVDQQRGIVEQVRSAQEPTSQSALNVNGNDLLTLGVPRGPEIGRILRLLTNDVVEDPMLNDREVLLERAQEYANARPV